MDTQENYSTSREAIEKEVEFEFFRSSGPGGQNVNKRETGVRLRHIPSGIVIEVEDERSQTRNKEIAFARLIEKLNILNKPAKPRIPIKIPKSEKRRRLEEKRRRSSVKELRKPPGISVDK